MEFPDLGEHCSEKSCKRLDFLPMKCDACEEIFCKDHVTYANHKCMSSYKKDVQVPVCPLCNTPIPIKRGEMPDIKVGEHIDRDCKSDPAQRKRKVFTNKCSKGGCKQKEMIKVTCEDCHLNFCLKHRHPLDHDCKTDGKPASKSGNAALIRSQGASSSAACSSASRGGSRTVSNGVSVNSRTHSSSTQRMSVPAPATMAPPAQNIIPASASFQAGLTEEQALQRALEMSLAESGRGVQPALSPQEQEDLALAQALAASEEEYRRQQQRQQGRETKQSTCSLS
ncbi:AN1-type zinc finger protein 2A isoform X1 [Hypomesus transpacificus]|uniref:AN1-type zinc finger protein 2A isoform X1 n=2 Tax=Hypomesus transpacificus TaxID=137520 RepID=UPI001F075487|nr:AN1-type zinc finger protein 2A isoform X1 [Hypomesus transpacificus]